MWPVFFVCLRGWFDSCKAAVCGQGLLSSDWSKPDFLASPHTHCNLTHLENVHRLKQK